LPSGGRFVFPVSGFRFPVFFPPFSLNCLHCAIDFPQGGNFNAQPPTLTMKAYGYAKKQVTPKGLYEMSEVTFTGASSSIREIARFLLAAADEMDSRGAQFDHSHIGEHFGDWPERWPDIIVARGR
jgi:hypothetical protein